MPKIISSHAVLEPLKQALVLSRGNESIYLHRSSPLVENGLDRPENRYGRYGFASFSSISMSTLGVDGARVCL